MKRHITVNNDSVINFEEINLNFKDQIKLWNLMNYDNNIIKNVNVKNIIISLTIFYKNKNYDLEFINGRLINNLDEINDIIKDINLSLKENNIYSLLELIKDFFI